jgi:hypothetical protein
MRASTTSSAKSEKRWYVRSFGMARVAVHRERFDGAQPRRRKRRERRRRWSPLAGSRAAEVGRRSRRRIASVKGPPSDDRGRGGLADEPAQIGIGQPMIREEEEVLRVNGCSLQRETDSPGHRARPRQRRPLASRRRRGCGRHMAGTVSHTLERRRGSPRGPWQSRGAAPPRLDVHRRRSYPPRSRSTR